MDKLIPDVSDISRRKVQLDRTHIILLVLLVSALALGAFFLGRNSQDALEYPYASPAPTYSFVEPEPTEVLRASPIPGDLSGSSESLEQSACEQAGGEWREFPNGCVDACGIDPLTSMCTQAFTFGCDCGPSACWDGQKCR